MFFDIKKSGFECVSVHAGVLRDIRAVGDAHPANCTNIYAKMY
jgi:hypothetical protein